MASTRNIRGISIEIGGDTTKLENSLKTVYQKSTDLTRELRGVDRALKFNPKNVELTSQKQKVLTEQVDNTRKRLAELKGAQEEVTRQYQAGEIDDGQYRAFQREIIETESILKTYERQLSEVSDKHKLIGKSMEEAGGKMKTAGKKISDVGGEMTKKLTLPIVGVGVAAGKLGIDFEKSMSEVAAVSGATGEELEQLEKAARDAGATTDKSARDAADALQYMALAGWDVEDSQQALMPILKLSSAANMDLGRTSDLVTDTMSVLGLEIDDLEGYLDVLAQTSRNSNTDVDQLGESFLVVGGKLTQLGVDVEDGAVALGLLADNGIKGSEAGRGLNAILTNLTAPTGRAKEALEELGISAFDSNGEFIGIEETLQSVADSTEDMTQEQQNMYLSMIAGKEHGKTLNALMGELGGGFDNLSGKVSGADGALEEMYDTATDNTMGAINNLRSAIEELGLKIFENLQPAIEKAVEFTQKLTDKFNSLTPEQQETIVQIGLMVAAIGPVLVVFGKMISVVGSTIAIGGKLIGSFGSILKVGGVLAKGLGATVGFIFSPAGAIMVGIAAVIAGGVLLWKNWDKVKQFGANLKDSLVNSWNTLKSNTVTKFNEIKDGIMKPINTARDAVKRAVDKMKGFFNFNWKLPKIKMPKFSVSGSANPLNWLKDGPPKLNVSWHAKGGILTRPGIFGMMGNTLLAGGEHRTGGEAILPLNRLPQIMADAMDRVNRQSQPAQPQVIRVEGNNEDLGQVTSLLTQLLHKSTDVYLGREKVGEIMDNEQGRKNRLTREGGLLMHTGIEFNGKHSLRDFGLTVSNREVGYPSKIKRQERVPFSNTVYDFSNLYGGQEYEERSITYTFNVINKTSSGYRKNFRNTQLLETKIVNWLMGANQKAILKDDTIDGYYFMAELVDGPNSEFRFVGSELTIEFIAYPFKISELQEGHDIWDEFNFELDIAQITKFEVSGVKEITLYNVGAEALVPTVVASSEFIIEKGAVSVTVPPGTSKSYLISLNVGENKLKLIGNGTIEFKFHKELI